MLLLSAGFLYWVLSNNLERADRQFLVDKILVLRMILQVRPEDPDALEEEVTWEGATRQFTKYYARVLDEQQRTHIETPGMSERISPLRFPAPIEATAVPDIGIKWRSHQGQSYFLLAAWAEVGHASGTQRLLQVALDVSHDNTLLADYRRKLALVLVVGVVGSAGAGVAVARQGMRPLKAITQAAQRITATQLHERLDPARWPKELTALATAFDEMLARLADAFARMSQFSADLAHELRTPLNNLMGEAEVALSRARTPDEYRQVLESSLEEYARLSRMIDSLLFLARADSPEMRLERSPVEALKELEMVRAFHEAMAEEQGIEVTCQGSALVYADPMLFRRALSNLLSNALQYTPGGGQVTMSVKAFADHSVAVSVRDTGCGIDSEHLPHVFDRFYRADRARSHYSQGTGLGLAIVKSIMNLHHGTVTIQSEPGKGTTVTLRFPAPNDTSKMSVL
jgi:two-component system, OmpR family, heavy metal sensor histidine kinase CusS